MNYIHGLYICTYTDKDIAMQLCQFDVCANIRGIYVN